MAGGLNLKFVPSCHGHGTPCYIKTGTSEGPNKGKSFFICGNSQEQCGFVRPATEISNSRCPYHGNINELSALGKKVDELRFYFRCIEGKKLRLGWCGVEKLKIQKSHGLQSLGDITNLMKEKMNNRKEDRLKSKKESMDILVPNKIVPVQEKENAMVMKNDNLEKMNDGSNDVDNSDAKSNFIQSKKHADVIDLTNSSSEKDVLKTDPELPTTEDHLVEKNEQVEDLNNIIEIMKRKHAVEREISARKGILKKIDRSKLPDNGQRLVDQIEKLEEMLENLKQSRNCSAEDDLSIWSKFSDSQPSNSENIKTGKDSGLNLDFHMPPSNGSAMLVPTISNPQQRLYDGRMTHSKLQMVGRVTRDAIEALHRSLETCPTATTECVDPIGLNVTLMTHQKQALAWLLWREKQNPSGGILADDMGLGKTLTSISLIMKDKQTGFIKKEKIPAEMKDSSGTLVVCPASLVHQWKSEIEKRVKPLNLTVCLYHGASRERNVDRLARYDVVLTTYSIVATETKGLFKAEEEKKNANSNDAWLTTKGVPEAKERKKNRDSLISQIHWRRIILDEAHNIKNHKCITSIATCYIEAESRWALTGTPIQNDTIDLYAIIKFLRCSPFNELKVWKKWVDDKSARGTERMNTLVKSLLLRRTKDQKDSVGKALVALPSRHALVHNINLTGNEQEIYKLLHLYSKNMLRAFLQDKAYSAASNNRNGTNSTDSEIDLKKKILGKDCEELLDLFGLSNRTVNAGAILLMVLRLRQCCSHLSLLCQILDEETCKDEGVDIPIEEQMMNMSIVDGDKSDWRPREFSSSFVSTKVHHLLTELEKLNKDRTDGKPVKSVIVSQWTKMLDIIAFHLEKKSFKYDFITGSVSIKKRNEIVENFNCNPHGTQIMLVSLKAGGVGLNLIGGSHLFLLDQHWNPALENQACDRVYRVGQKYNVFIHRFLCTDTIEEKITALQEKKRAIADTILKGGKQASNKLTLQDLRTLFGV